MGKVRGKRKRIRKVAREHAETMIKILNQKQCENIVLHKFGGRYAISALTKKGNTINLFTDKQKCKNSCCFVWFVFETEKPFTWDREISNVSWDFEKHGIKFLNPNMSKDEVEQML